MSNFSHFSRTEGIGAGWVSPYPKLGVNVKIGDDEKHAAKRFGTFLTHMMKISGESRMV